MIDSKNREESEYKILDSEEIDNNYWVNRLLA